MKRPQVHRNPKPLRNTFKFSDTSTRIQRQEMITALQGAGYYARHSDVNRLTTSATFVQACLAFPYKAMLYWPDLALSSSALRSMHTAPCIKGHPAFPAQQTYLTEQPWGHKVLIRTIPDEEFDRLHLGICEQGQDTSEDGGDAESGPQFYPGPMKLGKSETWHRHPEWGIWLGRGKGLVCKAENFNSICKENPFI